jgi:hypothetical protein
MMEDTKRLMERYRSAQTESERRAARLLLITALELQTAAMTLDQTKRAISEERQRTGRMVPTKYECTNYSSSIERG